ncbi:ribosomal protein L22 [Neorickettsia helminthoeca str. Oregon]|uniref:Large ribosomal subunit protein uL22 n=1 Tax=Neorickettsia helminthoeca str. Oregon TaxID=1286528 RepID=X5HLF3_9RICK|nr:50S ribosomal protein L22 [Neorickettsia helminthoeca]AHX11215.1 ribosomal protein L22 [Neorickettsia helminthoeca str. Oregon]
MRATYKNIKSSVQKINLVADLIRGKSVSLARSRLLFSKKVAARAISKVLMSSVSNAQNNFSVDPDVLYIKEISVGKGMSLKRFSARARGRSASVRKHYSNVSILLGVLDGSKG